MQAEDRVFSVESGVGRELRKQLLPFAGQSVNGQSIDAVGRSPFVRDEADASFHSSTVAPTRECRWKCYTD
ncbi:hypothetical protein LSAT2_012461 [Lamellibrachia satsuma]|nr:hypothetical protein LSAT2_012461 [Lamellibrachia satsuma]